MDCSDVLDREDRNALVNGEVERAQVEKVRIEERQVPVLPCACCVCDRLFDSAVSDV